MRDDLAQPKKKKSKTINSNDIKNIRKEMKKIIEETPVFPRKRKDSTQRSLKNHPISHHSKNLKSYSKSEELFSQPKVKKNGKRKEDLKRNEDLKEISFSMPMTSKIINLFSNNSSVYNSHKEL